MKQIVIVLAVFGVLSMVGCHAGSSDKGAEPTKQKQAEKQTKRDQEGYTRGPGGYPVYDDYYIKNERNF